MESGSHSITTPEGYIIPLSFRHGLPYMAMRPYTDSEFWKLPHVVLTSPEHLDPSTHDFEVPDSWYESKDSKKPAPTLPPHDIQGRSQYVANYLREHVHDDELESQFGTLDISQWYFHFPIAFNRTLRYPHPSPTWIPLLLTKEQALSIQVGSTRRTRTAN